MRLTFKRITEMVKEEFILATDKFGSFHNAHEGFAVLKEEIDELWDNVKLKQSNENRDELIKNEAIQVAAMAIRLIYDCCDIK